jgi:SSS family transporter
MTVVFALFFLGRCQAGETAVAFEFTCTDTPPVAIVSASTADPSAATAFQKINPHPVFVRLGGRDGTAALLFNAQERTGAVSRLPDLPVALKDAGAGFEGNRLFVVGGFTPNGPNREIFALDISRPESGWTCQPGVPDDVGAQPSVVGLHGQVYVAGCGPDGSRLFVYNPTRKAWAGLSPARENMRGFLGVSCGNDSFLFFNANGSDNRIRAYHRITGSWFEAGVLPLSPEMLGAVSEGTGFSVLSSAGVLKGTAVLRPTKYGIYDHLVVALLVIALVGVGVFFSNKEKSSGDYFRAGKRIPWWAAGLSLFASGASAISLMAMPGKAFADNWIYFSLFLFIIIIQLPLMLLVYIPLARRLQIRTANEYLERRFGLPVRLLGFVIYSLNQMVGRMAAVLLLPSIALSAIFGLPMMQSILIMGVVATIYVTLGGLEAVIWTDVLQAVVMLVAVAACALWALFSLQISYTEASEALTSLNKLQMFDWSFDWTAPTVLILFSYVIASSLGMIGDQTFIQRMQCTRSERESRKSLILQLAVAIPMNFVLFAMGTLLFLFYRTQPQALSPALKADGIFPFFAAQVLPPGMAGFVVAALLAATMSTVSGAINSVANLGVEDIYRRFFPKATDHRCLLLGRILTVSLGVFGTGMALLLAQGSLLSVWDLAIMITGIILAPISGIFVLGIFTQRANSFGVWVGTVVSVVVNVYAKFFTDLNALAFLTAGVFSCIIAGYLASFLAPRPTEEKTRGLTVFTLEKEKKDEI